MAAVEKSLSKYKHIVQFIKSQVDDGALGVSDQVPSESELTKSFHVSSITVRKAMESLVREGVVYRVKGKGTFVAGPSQPEMGTDTPRKVYLLMDVENLDTSLNKILRGIQGYLNGRGYLLVLENQAFCREFLNRETDLSRAGMILFLYPGDQKREELYRLYKSGVKFVCIDRTIGSFPVNYVGTNNHDADYAAVEYLIGLGHKRIGFLSHNFEVSSEKERYAGYRDALLDNGLNSCIEEAYDKPSLDAYVSYLAKGGCTAVVCANDLAASMLIERLKTAGLTVPGDISVIGFDDSDVFRYHLPALTTLRQDFESIGFEAARLLVKLMTWAVSGCKKIYLPAKLIVRDSTRGIDMRGTAGGIDNGET